MKQKLNAHTPGPWYVRGCDGNPGYAMGRHVYSPNEGNTGTVALVSGSLANARLIASAPDLLAALEVLESSTCGDVGDDGYEGCIRIDVRALDIARAAIAKAMGGSL